MNKDFHYGVVKVLARAAGLPEPEAELVAYASQHVDDAHDYNPMIFTKEDLSDLPLLDMQQNWIDILGGGFTPDKPILDWHMDGWVFEPVCTLHRTLDYIFEGLKPDVQRKVYMSFHFVPGESYVKGKPYCYQAKAGKGMIKNYASRIAEAIAEEAVFDRELALIALGISLHSFADTWAHEEFSGLGSKSDNGLSAVLVNGEKADWSLKSSIGDLVSIGHLEADSHPDTPHEHIHFDFERGFCVDRHNTNHFEKAAKTLLGVLCRITGRDAEQSWELVEGSLDKVFKKKLKTETRLNKLEEEFKGRTGFGKMMLNYDEKKWRKWAIRPGFDTNDFGSVIYKRSSHAKSPRWFKYHVAASVQRGFVREHIKPIV